MNQNVMPSLVQLDQETLKNLVAEVKETVATEFSYRKTRVFTSANLWKIRNGRKQTDRITRKWGI